MDLLIEKLDGSRYYLSQYKVLITEFEESAPSVTRNNMQLDQRNGNIDFGGWHTGKTIDITGYYRADDMDEEETLREKLYALLSNPDGYYITQLKTSPERAVERPGETSGNYYDKLTDYPSHKRFLVYTEAPELELVGNVNGTLLYKLTAEFKTMKLPYGESVPHDLDVKPNVPYYGRNLLLNSDQQFTNSVGGFVKTPFNLNGIFDKYGTDQVYTISYDLSSKNPSKSSWIQAYPYPGATPQNKYSFPIVKHQGITTTPQRFSMTFKPTLVDETITQTTLVFYGEYDLGNIPIVNRIKVTLGNGDNIAWSPAPEDSGYNEWYFDTYYNTDSLFIPYAGTVPCNQLEQQFAVELTAKGASSSLSFKIDETELTYSGGVASGDVFLLTGFSYTKNGLSIVSKTNKAYFILQPDKPNRITCNVPGTVKILGFQNLYA